MPDSALNPRGHSLSNAFNRIFSENDITRSQAQYSNLQSPFMGKTLFKYCVQ